MTEEQIKQKAKKYGKDKSIYYESNHGQIPSQLEKYFYLRDAYIAGATEATKELQKENKQAKKIIREYREILKGNTKTWLQTQAKAEAFLKE